MACEDFTGLACGLPLDYTYKLVRGKLPEKVVLDEGRYWIPDLREYPSLQLSIEKEGREICCIWDKKYGRFVSVTCRKNKETGKVVVKTIALSLFKGKYINAMHYIPVCVKLIGDPLAVNSISVDHIDQNHFNDCLKNLRWATPSEQNMNRTIIKSEEDYYDYEYELDNIKFDSLLKVFNYCKENNKIKENIIYENFKRNIPRYIEKNKEPYSLPIRRSIKQLANEEWKELNNKYELSHFTHISNHGRLGKLNNNKIIPRTITIDKFGYQRIKLKRLKKEFGVHTLVYEHFVGNIPEGYIVDHIDENKSNNHVSNLQIMTHAENIQKTMNTNQSHKTIVNIEVIDTVTNEVLSFINKQRFLEHFNITNSHYKYNIYKSSDNSIILNEKKYKINEIKNRDYEIGNKKRKVYMIDNTNNIIQSFNSIVEVSKYYKDNQINFNHYMFRQVINANREYNIPGVFWNSDESS